MTLQDLGRQLPSEDDINNYFLRIKAESDRGAAVMAAALVERALEDHIRANLHDPGDGTADTWFHGSNAPFRTFAAKITLGFALGLFDPKLEERISAVKNIRNAFAHCMAPLDFSHPAIIEESAKLSPVEREKSREAARENFAHGCLVLARMLGMKAVASAAFDHYVAPHEEGYVEYMARGGIRIGEIKVD